jgi:ABC-type sugar transport system ATPase subunit
MKVDLENLSKSFGAVAAVHDINLDIRDGEFVAFLGPSGCGKTTTLLMIAGIYRPTGGVIRFGERVVNTLQPRERNIGMVFQSYALYPHMSVFENIAYPLKLKGMSKHEQRERVQRSADVMGIGDLLHRRPGQLSGGQQQRVALGRALVKEPDVLLFDEPLSNLDARLRLTMRGEIKALQKRLGITAIYVTHDQVEALTMADRIAVINQGQLEAYDPPEDLYDHPRTLFIASFVGNPPMNLIPVQVTREADQVIMHNESLRFGSLGERARTAARQMGEVLLGVRPEDVHLSDDGPLAGEVFVVEPLGREDMIDIRVGQHRVAALVSTERRMKAGDSVRLALRDDKLQFFDPASGRSLLWM